MHLENFNINDNKSILKQGHTFPGTGSFLRGSTYRMSFPYCEAISNDILNIYNVFINC